MEGDSNRIEAPREWMEGDTNRMEKPRERMEASREHADGEEE